MRYGASGKTFPRRRCLRPPTRCAASWASADDHGEAVSGGQLAQARRYVDGHLTDPGLSAARAAAALRISERTLYALFETSGTTFAAHVRQRRLEECRAALLANPSRPVMDIAFAWGFGSMPSFYRAFHAAFGVSPSDLREAATLESSKASSADNEMPLCGQSETRALPASHPPATVSVGGRERPSHKGAAGGLEMRRSLSV